MNVPPLQDPIGGLAKRSWSIWRTPPKGSDDQAVPLGCLLARDEMLAKMFALLLWPIPDLYCLDSDAVPYARRNQCRARFLLDCDLAKETADFVRASTTGGVCQICACTEDAPCASGCWWVTKWLCSACCIRAGIDPKERAALELATRETTPDVFPAELTFEPDPTIPQLMRNACFALAGGDAGGCLELLVQAIAHLSTHVPLPDGGQRVIVNLRPDEEIQIIKKEPPHGPQ